MAPSLFSRPSVDQTQIHVQTSFHTQSQSQTQTQSQTLRQSKLKTISSLFHHPFAQPQAHLQNIIAEAPTGSAGESCGSPPQIIKYYQQPVGYSPSRVYRADGLPRGSTSSLVPSTPSSIAGAVAMAGISGLPPHQHQNVSLTSHTLQAQVQRHMPTLASAIHIPDAQPAAPPLSPQNGRVTVGRSAGRYANLSCPSLQEEAEPLPHELVPEETAGSKRRDRADSRASNATTTDSVRRKMSRRLSLDNILPRITGSLRKKDRPASGFEPLLGDKPIADSCKSSKPNASETAKVGAGPPGIKVVNPMAMPATRTWRSKFAVGKDKAASSNAAMVAAAKAELAAKHARMKDTETDGQATDATQAAERGGAAAIGRRYDEKTIRRVPVRGGMGSMSSLASARTREGSGFRHLIDRPASIASSLSFDPAATPRSAPSPSHYLVSDLGLTHSSVVATLDSPSPLPRPLHTPLNGGLHVSCNPTQTFIFSPAQDDMSIVDPERSPMPDLNPPSPVPALPSQYRQPPQLDMQPQPRQQAQPRRLEQITRQQSLSEIKGAFSRMRDLSGLEPASAPSSRRSSGNGPEDHQPASSYVHSTAVSQSASLASSTMVTAPSHPESMTSHSSKSWHTARASIDIYGPLPPLPAPLATAPSNASITSVAQISSQESRQTLLPRSRSKSHTDLSSYSSVKDLIEHTEKTQGPGWWSADKRMSRRASALPLDLRRNGAEDEKEEGRLAKSSTIPQRARFDEDPAQGETGGRGSPSPAPDRRASALLQDSRMGMSMRPRSSIDLRRANLVSSPSRSSFLGHPHSDVPRPRSALSSSAAAASEGEGHTARLSLVAGSTWGKPDSPRRTILSRRSTMALQSTANSAEEENLTPTRSRANPTGGAAMGTGGGGGGGSGPFVSSRISPDIARRAGWIARRYSEEESSPSRSVSRQTTRTTLSSSTAPTSLIPSDSEHEDSLAPHPQYQPRQQQQQYEEKVSHLTARHALELDAVLSALSCAKEQVRSSKEEIAALHRLLGEGVEERDKLRERVKELEGHVAALKLARMGGDDEQNQHYGTYGDCTLAARAPAEGPVKGGMKRSTSVCSSLLPELVAPSSPLKEEVLAVDDGDGAGEAEGEEGEAGEDRPDEFGRRTFIASNSEDGKGRRDLGFVQGRRIVSVSTSDGEGTTYTNVLFDESDRLGHGHGEDEEEGEGEGERGWTLKLSEDDERYLDDI